MERGCIDGIVDASGDTTKPRISPSHQLKRRTGMCQCRGGQGWPGATAAQGRASVACRTWMYQCRGAHATAGSPRPQGRCAGATRPNLRVFGHAIWLSRSDSDRPKVAPGATAATGDRRKSPSLGEMRGSDEAKFRVFGHVIALSQSDSDRPLFNQKRSALVKEVDWHPETHVRVRCVVGGADADGEI